MTTNSETQLEVMSAPIISTAHLTEWEINNVSKYFPTLTRNEGILVCDDPEAWGRLTSEAFPNLDNCFSYMRARGYSWIMFDRDADIISDLQSFSW